MKKITTMALIFCILIISTSTYANSGPTYWQGKQSSEILTIEDNTPISVKKENLVFDFTDEEYKDYSISSKVTAQYIMSNDSENSETVQMAFPLISSIQDFNPEGISIKIDDEKIDFQIFLGDMLYSRTGGKDDDTKFDFRSIAKSISSSEYTPKNYNLDERGTLYTYDIVSNSEDNLNIVIDHSYDKSKSKVMTKGFNGYQMIDGIESFVASNVKDEEFQIFLLGEDVDFKFKAYSDVELKNETEEYSLDVRTKEISIRDYLNGGVEIFKDEVDYLDYLADNQIFNLFAKQLDEHIEKSVINLGMDSLLSSDYMDMFFVLIYEVDFEPYSTKDISVSYNSSGTMDTRNTIEPIYTFSYILNPAKNWASFNDLNIEIRPPATSPYIINSSLNLTRKGDGTYTGNFETLPDEDLFFSLYYNEEITRLDKIKGYLRSNSYLITILASWLLIALIVYIIKRIYNKFKKVH